MTMTRIQVACCCLIASAFVLGGLVFVQVGERLPQNEAQAEMVVQKDHLTMLTTQFQGDSEMVYVLDGRQELLLAYILEPNRGDIELMGRLNLARVFERESNGQEEPQRRRRSR